MTLMPPPGDPAEDAEPPESSTTNRPHTDGNLADELLERVRSLMSRPRGRRHHGSPVDIVSEEDSASTMERLIGRATHTADVLLGGERRHRDAAHRGLVRLSSTPGKESVRTRLLYGRSASDQPAALLTSGQHTLIRSSLAPLLLVTAVIVDGEKALVRWEPEKERYASFVSAEHVIRSMVTFFDVAWRNSVAVADPLDLGDPARTATARRILSQLRDGALDEVSARELSMSVRTYRRYVAEIMNLLGATSRFQAGVKAAQLGLLSQTTPRGEGSGKGGRVS